MIDNLDNLVVWLANLIQNEPEALAVFLIVLALWSFMNTILIVVFTHSDIENIRKALRERGIWV